MPFTAQPSPTRRGPSTVAVRTTLAITGLIMALFVIVHMIGNLKIFSGTIDHYALWLRHVGEPLLPTNGVLWIMRVVLGITVVVHIAAGVLSWWRKRGGRRRHHLHTVGAWGARLMLPTGILIAVFLGVHILDLTVGTAVATTVFQPPTPQAAAASANMAASFSRPGMLIFYVMALVMVAIHLSHGLRTAMMDLGIRPVKGVQIIAVIIAVTVATLDGAVALYAAFAL